MNSTLHYIIFSMSQRINTSSVLNHKQWVKLSVQRWYSEGLDYEMDEYVCIAFYLLCCYYSGFFVVTAMAEDGVYIDETCGMLHMYQVNKHLNPIQRITSTQTYRHTSCLYYCKQFAVTLDIEIQILFCCKGGKTSYVQSNYKYFQIPSVF